MATLTQLHRIPWFESSLSTELWTSILQRIVVAFILSIGLPKSALNIIVCASMDKIRNEIAKRQVIPSSVEVQDEWVLVLE
jgi:hypothetical protein